MDLDEARIEAYLLDIKRKKANNPLVSSSLQARKPEEKSMHNDLDNSSQNEKADKTQLTQTSPKSPLNKSCNSNQGDKSTHINASRQRVRNIYATSKERTEYMPVPSLNSIGLLPDGAITIKDSYGGEAREHVLLHQPKVTSKKPPICNRKPQMTRLSAGLRETKSSSLRLIRDPEEVLRCKRKLIAGASQSQIGVNSKSATPTRKPRNIERERCSSNAQGAALVSYKARSLGPDELIDIEDIPFDTLEEMEKFMPELDRGSMENTERRLTKDSIEEKEKVKRKENIAKHTHSRIEAEEFTGSGEFVNSTINDLRESHSPVKKESLTLKSDKIIETTPDIIAQCFDKTGGDTQSRPLSNNKLDTQEKKDKKKKSKLSFKWLHQSKAEKVVPFPVKDDKRKQRSKTDLERIAALFCVETPQQAGLRRFLAGHEYVDDDEAFFKPGVWDCDIGSQLDANPRKPARRVDNRTDVDKVESGFRNVNPKNNGRCLENGAITGMHKMSKRLKMLAKNAK